ncbi:hypothetical protein niasHT_017970 [Heterodera trifolii]|uniref:Gustatory receptor n=1 Tax=Heterodera trifolii TaxID=157864 RepID=A0ABD2LBV0_9BILA
MATLNATGSTSFEYFLLFFGAGTEMGIHLFGIPLSIANLFLVARTSVIHPNMKAILISQSFLILLRGICRFIICLYKFILWDPIVAESVKFFPPLGPINYMGHYGRNFVPHILIIERVFATLFVQSYERHRGCLFTIIWSPIALTVTVYISFTTVPQGTRPLANLVTTLAQLLIGCMELCIFYLLCRYNSKIYKQMLQIADSHCLSLRYQLSENIRIGKQLIPPLVLNLFIIFLTGLSVSWSHFQWPKFYQMYNLCTNLISAAGFLIELSLITCHPFLKRDVCQIWHHFIAKFAIGLRRFLSRNHLRIGDQTAATGDVFATFPCATSPAAVGIAQRDLISGKTLMEQLKSEEHFAMLKKAWERPKRSTTV